jgi:anti-sigma factor (TIGR02949 family)
VSAPARVQLEAIGLSSTCADVLRHLWDYLDDQITPEGAERLRAHIASCSTCHSYETYQACFLETVKKLRVELGAPDALRARLAERLKEQGCGCWERVRTER